MISVPQQRLLTGLAGVVMALLSGAAVPAGAPAVEQPLKLFGSGVEVLPVDQAFVAEAAALDGHTVLVRFAIAPGTYLYRDKLKFALQGGSTSLGQVQLPAAAVHRDDFFGDSRVYRKVVEISLPVVRDPDTDRVTLELAWQGCADVGVCYPPQQTRVLLDFSDLR